MSLWIFSMCCFCSASLSFNSSSLRSKTISPERPGRAIETHFLFSSSLIHFSSLAFSRRVKASLQTQHRQ